MRVVLPWPPVELSPNTRLAWQRKRVVVKRTREAAVQETRSQRPANGIFPAGSLAGLTELRMTLRWYPPDHRHYDLDNLLARTKSTIDGMCRGLGLDRGKWGAGDAAFRSVLLRQLGKPVRGGCVVVLIERDPDDVAFRELAM